MSPETTSGTAPALEPEPIILPEGEFEADAPLKHSSAALDRLLREANRGLQVLTTKYNRIVTMPILLTPELAKELLDGQNKGNRHKTPARSKKYANLIHKGNFLFTGEALLFNTEGRLIEGQHRCDGVVISGTAIIVMAIWELPIEGRELQRARLVLGSSGQRTPNERAKFGQIESEEFETTSDLLNVVRYYNSGLGKILDYDALEVQDMLEENPKRYHAALEFVKANMDESTKFAFKSGFKKITFSLAAAKLFIDDLVEGTGQTEASEEFMLKFIAKNNMDEGNPVDSLKLKFTKLFSHKEHYNEKRAENLIPLIVKCFKNYMRYLEETNPQRKWRY